MSSALHTENTHQLTSPGSSQPARAPGSLRAVTVLLLVAAALAIALPWLWFTRLLAFDHNLFIPPSHESEYLPRIIAIGLVGCATSLTLALLLHRHSQRAYLVTVGITGGMALGVSTNQVIFTPDPLSMVVVAVAFAMLIPLTSHSLARYFLDSHASKSKPATRVAQWRSGSFLGLTCALAASVSLILWTEKRPVFPVLMEPSVVTGEAHTPRPFTLSLAILCLVLLALMLFTALMLWRNHRWANALAVGMATYGLGLCALLVTYDVPVVPLVVGVVCAVATIVLTLWGERLVNRSGE